MHLKDWQKKFTPITIDMANNLLNEIRDYKVENNRVTGTVDGFNAEFTINSSREVESLHCNCEFALSGNLCKHEAALILNYENTNKETGFETDIKPYPLDLVWLEKNNLISPMTKEFLADRNMISLPSYRFFDCQINGEAFFEVICDKYKEGKGRLFLNAKEFYILDVDLSEEAYAIFDIFMAAKLLYPAYIRDNLKKFDEFLVYETKEYEINTLSESLKEEEFPTKLELQPILDTKTKSVSYKLIAGKSYVIKDLQSFSNDIINHLADSYGKISFIHGYECFTKPSQKHLDFILYQVNINKSIVKDIPLDTPYAIDFFFSTCKNQNIKVDKVGDVFLQVSNQPATIILKSKTIEIFDRDKILFVGALGAYYDNDNIIEYRRFPNPRVRKVFAFLAHHNGVFEHTEIFNNFLIKIFPKIKRDITITDEFYEANYVPNLEIKTYISLNSKYDLLLKYVIFADGEEIKSPSSYSEAVLDVYEKYLIDNYRFSHLGHNYFTINDIKDQYNFLNADLSDLKEFGPVYLSDEVNHIKPRHPKKITINAKYNIDLLNLSITGVDYDKEDIKNILDSYKKKQKFVRLKDGSILELNEKIDYLREIISDFQIDLEEDFTNISRPLSYAFKLLHHDGYDVSLDESMQKFFTKLENYKKTEYYIPEHLKKLLKPYQIEANSWLNTLAKSGFGGILADDMGLGKTIEMISLLLGDEVNKPSIVVCPMSLVYNWQEEIEKWNVNIKCLPIVGNAKYREDLITNINPNEKMIYISSYDSLRRDLKFYKTKFRFIIADEAQYIKNQSAQKSEAIKQIDSEVRFALTGTPIENGLQDVWNIFDFVAPGYLSNYQSFKARYEDLILSKDARALHRLQSKLKPFILRRTKKDVLKELKDKTETIYYTRLNSDEAKIYDANVLKLKDELECNDGAVVLSMLTRLRQICVHPGMFLSDYKAESSKLQLCVDILKKAISGNHKSLVFSQFTSVFPFLEEMLKANGIEYLKITGQVKAEERIRLVNKFNESDIPVMMISLKAGGTGLNLQSADTVIHLDPWWNISVENQATDRAHRIGQKNQVNVIKLVAKNTIEDKVLELQKMKKDLADSIMSKANANSITMADIKTLINS